MKRKFYLLLSLSGMLAFVPAKLTAAAKDGQNVLYGAKMYNSSPIIYVSGGGYVESGQNKKFKIDVVHSPGSEYTVKFGFSTGSGTVQKDGQAVALNAALPISSGNSEYVFETLSNGMATLAVTVTNSSSGQSSTENIMFLVASNATTYKNGAWTSGLPAAGKYAIVEGNYSGQGFSAEELQVNEGASFILNENGSLKLYGQIWNYGNMEVLEGGSILQENANARNLGSITYNRKTTPMRKYDYTYWGSPVSGQTLVALSPQTIADKFYKFDAETQSWVIVQGGAETMQAGKGYIIRAPQSFPQTGAGNVFNGVFRGVPNNGSYTTPVFGNEEVDSTDENPLNLLSNPYPSALDADLFMNAPVNQNILGGTVYLWTHATMIDNLHYSADDYAKFNATGGVKTKSLADGGIVPTGKIGAGQGFFIGATGIGNASFNNSMRSEDNSQFFRPSSSLEKHRLWITASNSAGAYDETLLGYVENATDGADRLFDGKFMEASKPINIYTFIGEGKYVINGKSLPDNSTDDIVNIGYKSSADGEFSFKLDLADGFFEGSDLPVYLVDSMHGNTHNLKEGAYTFSTLQGTFDERFHLRIPFATLSVNGPSKNSNLVSIYASDGKLNIRSSAEQITSVDVFDLTGRKILSKSDLSVKDLTIPVSLNAGIYIVKARMGSLIVTKKINF